MSIQLQTETKKTGTRFRVFPQPRFLEIFSEPETIYISIPAGSVKEGPSDERMFVIDPIQKDPYSKAFMPQFKKDAHPPVKPNSEGHFDHLEPDSRDFYCAAMYATVRMVLDIWEDYFKHEIAWYFDAQFDRLELIPFVEWGNAQSGYGFLEFGYFKNANGMMDHNKPYCENFDVLAHEVGHSIIYSEVGEPGAPNDEKIDYNGMHESAADLVAIISSLHFDALVNLLLESTSGNLFTVNELDRVGELSKTTEIRTAFNNLRMSDVNNERHARSLPLTGAIFDVMVEVFQKSLVDKNVISADLAERSTHGAGKEQDLEEIQNEFNVAYSHNKDEFKKALLEARDYIGFLLAELWSNLDPNFLKYHTILRGLLKADRKISNGAHQKTIRECFLWREISLSPDSEFFQFHTIVERHDHVQHHCYNQQIQSPAYSKHQS